MGTMSGKFRLRKGGLKMSETHINAFKNGMRKDGKVYFYLTTRGDVRPTPGIKIFRTNLYTKSVNPVGTVSDFYGEVKFDIHAIKIGEHNFCGHRLDFDFEFEGEIWHGTQYGNMTDVAVCYRTKKKKG